MACEKYSGRMTEAALGALSAAPQAELRAHAAGCITCRTEFDAMRALVAAMDRGVEAMVAGEPSAQFAARLRATVAEAPAPAAWPHFTWPRFAMASLAVAAVLLAVFVARAPQRGGQQVPIEANSAGRIAQPVFSGKVAAPEIAAPASRRGTARPRSQAAAFSMEVLVPRGQLAAALVLSSGVSAGTIDGAQLARLAEQSAEPLELKTLEIQPLAAPSVGTDAVKAASADDGNKN